MLIFNCNVYIKKKKKKATSVQQASVRWDTRGQQEDHSTPGGSSTPFDFN